MEGVQYNIIFLYALFRFLDFGIGSSKRRVYIDLLRKTCSILAFSPNRKWHPKDKFILPSAVISTARRPPLPHHRLPVSPISSSLGCLPRVSPAPAPRLQPSLQIPLLPALDPPSLLLADPAELRFAPFLPAGTASGRAGADLGFGGRLGV